jgi:hypothetical protein
MSNVRKRELLCNLNYADQKDKLISKNHENC